MQCRDAKAQKDRECHHHRLLMEEGSENEDISNLTICLTVWMCLMCLKVSDLSDSVWNQRH